MSIDDLTDRQHRLLDALPEGAPAHVCDLRQRLGLTTSEVASDLLALGRLGLAEVAATGWRRAVGR